jgi:hypothetical protein
MALLTLEGIYRNGTIEFAEEPADAPTEGPVLVTFLASTEAQQQVRRPVPSEAETRELLRQQAFAQMRQGIPLGGPPYPRREELHDRFTS